MDIINLFEDYLNLNYIGQKNKELIPKDQKIDDNTIIRTRYLGYTIYYLNSGSSLFIPREWFDIFEGLYINNSKQILYNRPNNNIEKFIQKMTLLFSNKYNSNFLDILGDICIIGTSEIKDYLKKLGINIGSFEFKSLEKNFNI